MRNSIRGALLIAAAVFCANAPALELHGPASSVAFGTTVRFLPNGNFVVVDPFAGPIPSAGAVHLYRPDGSLISTIRGDREQDAVGVGGIVVLDDGNFLILSPNWHRLDESDGGAVTWVDAAHGIAGTVSSGNSLLGTHVGYANEIVPLPGGDYFIASPTWTDDASVRVKGAAAWITGGAPAVGRFSATNALVGSQTGDGEGVFARQLANGNVVVVNSSWSTSGGYRFGATTFFSRTVHPVGTVSAANSLVGSRDGDGANLLVRALANGNYVVANSYWSRDGLDKTGAVTWGDGHVGTRGEISASNSIVGHREGDGVGAEITPLANGDYVISSPTWDKDNVRDAGAVTWVDGGHAATGEVTSQNSLTGSTEFDGMGIYAVALANGNYVVADQTWNNGSIVWAGSITWEDGSRPASGVISASNSLVGTTPNEGISFVLPLTNGHYVVSDPNYDGGRGAVRWMDGTKPTSGVFSGDHALTGSTEGDRVGYAFALTDGNYVVSSPGWNDGTRYEVGAVTWADGTRETSATVSAANSLIGSHEFDRIGGCEEIAACPRITALPNGAFAVSSPEWDASDFDADVGSVVLSAGHAPLTGVLSASSALTGSSTKEFFGAFWPTVFDDGTIILRSITAGDDLGAGIGIGIVAPRHAGNAVNGIVGMGVDDVIGHSPSSDFPSVDYDPRSGTMIVGEAPANLVTLHSIARPSTVRGHSRHARLPR